ncbi:unnamed protein product [Closterium sp. Naga37s-1]|nr:unnamed protein product [Closterium sp. Naga37s-1]
MANAPSSNLPLRLAWLFSAVAFTLVLSGTSLAVASHDKPVGAVGTTSNRRDRTRHEDPGARFQASQPAQLHLTTALAC